jgi:ribosomal protein L11 methyltransferase
VPPIRRSIVEDHDWTEEWRKSYVSFPIGDDFFVIPSWEESKCPEERLPIRIDPGQAFGTGTHETTQLSIEALERWVDEKHVVLDIGTGSGILAIAARLLGANKVLACDIEPVSAQVAQANIERNAENQVWTICGSADAIRSGSISLVLANLTADLIISLFVEIDRVLRPRGLAVLSGILNEQQEEIRNLIQRHHYSIFEEIARGEWLAIVIEKNVA